MANKKEEYMEKINAVITGVGIWLAAQCFAGILI